MHDDPMIGQEIDGRFTITNRIGVGGMGAVYAAIQHSIHREVAIKIIAPELATQPSIARRFLRECWLASRLKSPYIAAVHDSGQTDDGLLYMVMEKIEGRTLSDELRRCGRLATGRAIQIGVQICRALEAAHDAGVVHRDLKPANIMLGPDDSVVVLDFGLAKSFTGANLSVTEAGILVGTAHYIAPELIRGDHAAPTADLYALGALLHTMLAGERPFFGDDLAVLRAHVLTPAPRLEHGPDALADVVQKLLEKSPDKRFQSAAALREALVEAVSEPPPIVDQDDDELRETTVDVRRLLPPVDDLASIEISIPDRPIEAPPIASRWRTLAVTLAVFALLAAAIASGAASAP